MLRSVAPALALAATLAGCSFPRPIDDFKQEVWTAQKSDVKEHLNAVQFLDASNGYAVGANGLVLKTSDGGGTWTPIYPIAVAGKELRGLSFLDVQQGYAISEQALYRTEDGGTTWKEVRDFKAKHADKLRAVRFLTPSAGFVVGAKGIYQTLDGSDWVKADVTQGSAVEPAGTTVFVAGNYVYSTDLTGVYLGVPASGAICAGNQDCGAAMHFRTLTEGWLLAGSGSLYGTLQTWVLKRTRDGGQTWTDADPSGALRKMLQTMGPFPPRVRFATADHGWVIQNGDFVATADGGQSWQRQAQFRDPDRFSDWSVETPNFGFRDLAAPDATHAWLVGTEGRIYKFENRYYPPLVDENGLQLGAWRL